MLFLVTGAKLIWWSSNDDELLLEILQLYRLPIHSELMCQFLGVTLKSLDRLAQRGLSVESRRACTGMSLPKMALGNENFTHRLDTYIKRPHY